MSLNGLNVVITAGPTYEPIDPVRFIGNHSSGKMGYAIASDLVERGAKVKLISGPSHQSKPDGLEKFSKVMSAEEMFQETILDFEKTDVFIFSAAVADYTPKVVSNQKIKKNDDTFSIEMVKTKDIAKEVGGMKLSHQRTVGFALETNNEEVNAKKKLESKNLDFVVLNSTQDSGAGFGVDTNKVTFFDGEGKTEFGLKSKVEVAKDIVDKLESILNEETI